MPAQSSLLSIVQLPEFSDLVRRSWAETQNVVVMNAKSLFILDPIGANAGKSKLYQEYDTETYADDKPEGSAVSFAKTGVGYSKTAFVKTIGKGIEITIEDRVQNRYQEVTSKLRSLNKYCANRIDLDLSHVLTFATSTSYTDMNGNLVDATTGDGLSLANAAHTLAFSATTYRNRVAGDPAFSETSLEAAEYLAQTQILNNFGQRRRIEFNTIFYGDDPATARQVKQLITSEADIDAVQAGVKNVYLDRYMAVYLPNLATTATGLPDSTKRRWWGISSAGKGLDGWQAYFGEVLPPFLKTPAPGNNGEDINTWNWVYVTGAMYLIATPNPRGLIMSCPVS